MTTTTITHTRTHTLATVYVSIGNSDDKLPQARWAEFAGKVHHVLANAASAYDGHIHGSWFSLACDPSQNACWCIELPAEASAPVRAALASLAGTYEQDSITWAEASTELIAAEVQP